MNRSAQELATIATNSFISDFVERHGECQATRQEAWETVARLENMAADVVNLVLKYEKPDDVAGTSEAVLGCILSIYGDEFGLAAALASSTLEKITEEKELTNAG